MNFAVTWDQVCASIVCFYCCIVKNRAISFDTSETYVRIQTFKFKPVVGFIFGNLLAKLKGFSHKQRLLQTLVLKKSRISGSRYEEQIQLPDLESTVQSLPVAVAGASLDPVFLFQHRSLVSIVV